MNSPFRKLIAALLSAAMLISLVPATALAVEEQPADDVLSAAEPAAPEDTPDTAPADVAEEPDNPAPAAPAADLRNESAAQPAGECGPEDTPDADPDDAAPAVTATVYSDFCGGDAYWTLDTSTGVLSIIGSGAIDDINNGNPGWYEYRSSITSVVIGEDITYIGEWAFYQLWRMESIVIPYTVTEIGQGAFSMCQSLAEVRYAGTTAGWNAVAIGVGNDDLTSAALYHELTGTCGEAANWRLNFNTGVLSITGTGAMEDYPDDQYTGWYEYRGSITSVEIGEGITHIGQYVFYQQWNMKSVAIPSTVTEIGKGAFSMCDALEDIHYTGSLAG